MTNVEVLAVLRESQALRGGGSYTTAGRTAEERARLLEAGRFEKRVADYVRATAPRELQDNPEAAAQYVAWLLDHGMSPLEAVQLANHQPLAEVDLHTVCKHLHHFFSSVFGFVLNHHKIVILVGQMVPNFAQRFDEGAALMIISELQNIIDQARAAADHYTP